MQEVDAERRIQVLRGQRPSTPPPPPAEPSQLPPTDDRSHKDEISGKPKKRRRLAGENDTDRDIRFAQEDAAQALAKREELALSRRRDDDAVSLVDKGGHINLFASETDRKPAATEKNAEAEAETEKNRRTYEDQYTMRFSNAAGFKKSVDQKPWYSSSVRDVQTAPDTMPGKDLWGNEDPMRREREVARLDANDPLGAMRKGIRQLKSVEQQREDWREEKRRELEDLKADDSRRSSHRHRRRPVSRRSESEDSLEGFRLDSSPDRNRGDDDRKRSSHRHHRRHHHRHRRDKSRVHSHTEHGHRSRSHSRPRSHSHRHRHHSRHDSEREKH